MTSTHVPAMRRRRARERRTSMDPGAALVALAHGARAWARHVCRRVVRLLGLRQRGLGTLATTLTHVPAVRRRRAWERRTSMDPGAALVALAHGARARAVHMRGTPARRRMVVAMTSTHVQP